MIHVVSCIARNTTNPEFILLVSTLHLLCSALCNALAKVQMTFPPHKYFAGIGLEMRSDLYQVSLLRLPITVSCPHFAGQGRSIRCICSAPWVKPNYFAQMRNHGDLFDEDIHDLAGLKSCLGQPTHLLPNIPHKEGVMCRDELHTRPQNNLRRVVERGQNYKHSSRL